jgi:glycerophosphoryl diester phosphodiesterase
LVQDRGMSLFSPPCPWPLPTWIAHRGGGSLAPENTLAAFRKGASHGFTAFECDAKLSRDGVLFLLHDDTLDRTTNRTGPAAQRDWAELEAMDAGSWHSPEFATEKLATLEAAMDWCWAMGGVLNIEIKPCPGLEAATGQAVANLAAAHPLGYAGALVLSSFAPQALQAAQHTTPHVPRMALVEKIDAHVWAWAQAIGCQALAAEQASWTPTALARCQTLGWASAAYTVNDGAAAARLLACGVTSVFTDAIDHLGPGAPTTKPASPG